MLFDVTGVNAAGNRDSIQLDARDAAEALAMGDAQGLKAVSVSPAPVDAPAGPIALSYQTPGTGIMLRGRWMVMLIFLGVEGFCVLGLCAFALLQIGSGDRFLFLILALTGLIYMILQLGLMLPVLRPRATATQPKAVWRWLSALSLGVLLGVLLFGGMLLAADLIWSSNPALEYDFLGRMVYASLFVTGGLWLISVPLIFAFMRRRPAESVLAKLAASLFLGSVVEFIAGVPIVALAQRRDSCYCAHASFWSMVLAAMNATLVLGPMVFLIILARRTRAVSHGCCAACGFDLRPLVDEDRCPNCGGRLETLHLIFPATSQI